MDKSKITPVQFLFSVAVFLQASGLLTSFLFPLLRQDAWIGVIVGAVLFLLLYFIMFALVKRHPGKNLVEINDEVFGKTAGKLVSLLYLWFFLNLSSLNLKDLGTFVNLSVMPRTPPEVLSIPFILICAWTIKKGLNVATRYSLLFALISFAVVIISFIFLFPIIKPQNLLPIFDQPFIRYIQTAHTAATIPFGELVIMMMIIPSVNAKPAKIPKLFLIGVLIGVGQLLLVILRDTLVLGSATTLFGWPGFHSLRLIDFWQTFTRMEILFAVTFVIMLFSKVCILLYVTLKTICSIIGVENNKYMAYSLALVVCLYSFIVYSSPIVHAESGRSATPPLWTIFEYILPAAALFVTILRGKKQDKKLENLPSRTSQKRVQKGKS